MMERDWQPVRRWRAAVIAGALVALQVVVAFSIRPVPDAVVSLLGGPGSGVDRLGGLRVRYRPPTGLDARELERSLAQLSSVRREEGALALEFPEVPEQLAPDLADILEGGGLTMRVVGEAEYAATLARYAPDGVTLEDDFWSDESDGGAGRVRHHVQYLAAPTRAHLAQTLAQASANGWRPTLGSAIVLESFEDYRTKESRWRTYEASTEVAINSTMLASATPSNDPNTGRPVVLLDFTEDGAQRFCNLTQRIAGHKLAMVLGGRVRSAPVINGAICGGRASIALGGSDVRTQETERDMLATVLSRPALPPGGTVERHRWYPPAEIAATEWVGRLLLGVGAGGLVALALAMAIAMARPHKIATAERVAGAFPWRRLAVTLLGLAALILGRQLIVPGLNEPALEHLFAWGAAAGMSRGSNLDLSIVALGVVPILTAFGVVELAALAIPRLRWRRHDPRGRVGLGRAVAVVACVTALVQGYFIASFLETMSSGASEVVTAPGWTFRILVMLTLATGTLLLGVVAGMISEHGLGNGYGVLVVGVAIIKLAGPLVTTPARIEEVLDRGHALGLITLLAIMIATAATLRWRITGGEREGALRVPSSGIVPLSDGGGLVFALVALAGVGLGSALKDMVRWMTTLQAHAWLGVALIAALVPLWSWLFAASPVTARVAREAGLAPMTRETWARATLASGILLVGVAALVAFASGTSGDAAVLADPVIAMIGTAVVLDMIADARAHRRVLAPAAVLHQIQLAGVVEHALAEAGIPCHIHASHLRTLFAFFGPWAPAVVLVPEAHAEDARRRLDDLRTTMNRS
jgi:hypothetical protein